MCAIISVVCETCVRTGMAAGVPITMTIKCLKATGMSEDANCGIIDTLGRGDHPLTRVIMYTKCSVCGSAIGSMPIFVPRLWDNIMGMGWSVTLDMSTGEFDRVE